MSNDPDRTYIFARLWLDFPLNTVTEYTFTLSDSELARVLDGCAARTVRRTFVETDVSRSSAESFGASVDALRTWTATVPPLSSESESALGESFMDSVGQQYLAYALLDQDRPRHPQWVVTHAVPTLEIAHNVMECLHRSPPWEFDAEMFAVQKLTLKVAEWARLERQLLGFDHRAVAMDMKTLLTPKQNPYLRFRANVVEWARIIQAGMGDGSLAVGVAGTPASPTTPATQTDSPNASAQLENSFLSASDLAKHLRAKPEQFRKLLERARQGQRLPDSDWFENPERGPRSPKYLYRLSAVAALIDRMRAAGELSGEVSDECPPTA